MKFSLKIFISVFLTTLALGTFGIWSAYHHVSAQTQDEYISRYSAFSQVMANTLTRLDHNTESLMLNAAKVVAERDAREGILPTNTLRKMTAELHVTHIFVVDHDGRFIRSTNEDPKLIPNAFTFSKSYRNLFKTGTFASTPIIQPKPEPKPYKFLFVPSLDKKRLIEVGVRVDFLADTLTEALKADGNLLSMSLYSPDGKLFGKFNSKKVELNGGKTVLTKEFPSVLESPDHYTFYTKVTSSHPSCTQCENAGTSINGEYYYVLGSEISKHELKVLQFKTRKMFFLLAFLNLLFAAILSQLVSRALVRNIEMAACRVRAIKKTGNLSSRINMGGKDEVAFLTNEFDRMLDSVEKSQAQVVEAEKVQIKVQMAREIAHNIKSPAIAIEMMIPLLGNLPDKLQKVFRDSVREIKELAQRLSRQADGMNPIGEEKYSLRFFEFVEEVILEKQIEHSGSLESKIELSTIKGAQEASISVEPIEFRAVLSNVINNAFESYGGPSGRVVVEADSDNNRCFVKVRDFGAGIPADILPRLGKTGVSLKKEGKGVGLMHANRVLESWGGRLRLESYEGQGTTVTIELPNVRIDAKSILDKTGAL